MFPVISLVISMKQSSLCKTSIRIEKISIRKHLVIIYKAFCFYLVVT